MNRDVTISITNYNGAGSLSPVIKALLAQDYKGIKEIILADNASTDDSVALVKREFPTVRILSNPDNRGPNPARNLGIKEARTDLVLVMDNDIIFAPDYVSLLVSVFNDDPAAGAAMGQVRLHGEPDVIQYTGANIHYAGATVNNKIYSRFPVKVACVSAGAVLLDRQKALKAGLYDEDLVFGWEDGDFTFRLTMMGHACYVMSNAICYHMKQKRESRWIKYQVRNRWWFMIKNYDTWTLIVLLPGILFYQLMILGYCTMKGKILDYIIGTAQAMAGLSKIARKKAIIRPLKTRRDSEILTSEPIDSTGEQTAKGLAGLANRIANFILYLYWLPARCLIR
jgi:GT2 family glycosyltransferase